MNPIKGEAQARVGDETFTLVLDFNALAAFEDTECVNAFEFFASFDANAMPRVATLRRLVHATLYRHHPDATEATAGDILSADVNVVLRLMQAAFPKAEGPAGNAAGGRKSR